RPLPEKVLVEVVGIPSSQRFAGFLQDRRVHDAPEVCVLLKAPRPLDLVHFHPKDPIGRQGVNLPDQTSESVVSRPVLGENDRVHASAVSSTVSSVVSSGSSSEPGSRLSGGVNPYGVPSSASHSSLRPFSMRSLENVSTRFHERVPNTFSIRSPFACFASLACPPCCLFSSSMISSSAISFCSLSNCHLGLPSGATSSWLLRDVSIPTCSPPRFRNSMCGRKCSKVGFSNVLPSIRFARSFRTLPSRQTRPVSMSRCFDISTRIDGS